jgi:hypothetical protein
MRIFEHSLCCVCSHFASGEAKENLLRRSQDYAETLKKATFPPLSEGKKKIPLGWMVNVI